MKEGIRIKITLHKTMNGGLYKLKEDGPIEVLNLSEVIFSNLDVFKVDEYTSVKLGDSIMFEGKGSYETISKYSTEQRKVLFLGILLRVTVVDTVTGEIKDDYFPAVNIDYSIELIETVNVPISKMFITCPYSYSTLDSIYDWTALMSALVVTDENNTPLELDEESMEYIFLNSGVLHADDSLFFLMPYKEKEGYWETLIGDTMRGNMDKIHDLLIKDLCWVFDPKVSDDETYKAFVKRERRCFLVVLGTKKEIHFRFKEEGEE